MPIHYFLSKLINEYRRQAMQAAFSIKDVIYRVLGVLLITSLILWLSVFFYASFYYSYMPVVSHTRPVHFTFSSCEKAAGVCSNPQANVVLTTNRQILMDGQPYKIFVDLEMPESEVNQKLGMFLVHMQLKDYNGKTQKTSRKIAMMKYKSSLLQTIYTLCFAPLLLAGPIEEKQTVSVEMFANFEEDPSNPVTAVWIEIESKWIQLYSASLRLQAHFVGLRYFMFHWPVIAAVIGITTNALFLFFIVGCIWYKLLRPNPVIIRVGYPATTGHLLRSATSPSLTPAIATVEPQPGSPNRTLEQRRMEAREKILRDRQRKLESVQGQVDGARVTGDRTRSLSVGSLPRIEEVSQSSASDLDFSSYEQVEDDAGLVMGALTIADPERSLSEPQLRHRTTASVSHQSP